MLLFQIERLRRVPRDGSADNDAEGVAQPFPESYRGWRGSRGWDAEWRRSLSASSAKSAVQLRVGVPAAPEHDRSAKAL